MAKGFRRFKFESRYQETGLAGPIAVWMLSSAGNVFETALTYLFGKFFLAAVVLGRNKLLAKWITCSDKSSARDFMALAKRQQLRAGRANDKRKRSNPRYPVFGRL